MKRLRDRVAVVTGAGGGIGRATSLALAKRGCDLALVDISESALGEVAAEVERLGRRASRHVVDVTDEAAMRGLPEAVLSEHGAAHVLVNNAGVNATAALHQQSDRDFGWVMDTNLSGVLYGTRAFLPTLRAADEAHVVTLSSIAGLVPLPTQVAYCTTKFAVRGFSESLAIEMSGTRVGVTCVHPGTVRTEVLRAARFDDDVMKRRLVALMDRFGIDPRRVARGIVRAIRHDRRRVIVGPDAHLLWSLSRLSPRLYRAGLGALYRRVVNE